MVEFEIKKVLPHYNLTFMKEVHKRNGEVTVESGDTFYTIPLEVVKNKIAHAETQRILQDEVSLVDYIREFNKQYVEVCELLKKIL